MTGIKPLRLLFVTGTLSPGGAELHLLKLLRVLDPSLVESHVIHFAYGDLYEEYQKTPAVLHFIERGTGSFPVKLLRSVLAFMKTVKQINPDVINSQLPETNLLTCFLVGRKYPIVVSERGLGRTRKPWERLLRKTAYRRASHFLANSPATVRRMLERERIPVRRVSLINNIIDVPSVSVSHVQETGREEGEVLVMAVGGLREVKGFSHLINATGILSDIIPGISLAIVGEGPERSSLEELIRQLQLGDRIALLGYRADAVDLLSTADVFVSSSLSEGQSNSILEAMALGVPIVATSVGGTTSLLANGDAGILVPPGDPATLAEGIRQCISEGREAQMRVEKAKEIIRNSHSPETIRNQYMAIYEMLAKRGDQCS